MLSLTAHYRLSELKTPGKSGSFFYYSRWGFFCFVPFLLVLRILLQLILFFHTTTSIILFHYLSFFYSDKKYLIKTVSRNEGHTLRNMIQNYYLHITQNPNTFLSRVLGLHKIATANVKKTYFVVIGNIFSDKVFIYFFSSLKSDIDSKFSTFLFMSFSFHSFTLGNTRDLRSERIHCGENR